MNILIAEDEKSVRMMLKAALRKTKLEPIIACDGREAWDILCARDDIRLVLTDWMMPEMDGLSLVKKIRERKSDKYTYIIMLTALATRHNMLDGFAAGADDYVSKPFHISELLVRIKAGERVLRLEDALSEKNEELTTLNNKLAGLARVDALSQIGNRLAFNEEMEKRQAETARYNRGYAVIMCDIDRFKQYNDTYGHPAGDKLIRLIAATLKAQLRSTDQVFRYGGEEFAVVLPEQDIEGAATVAEKIRAAVENNKSEHKGSDTGILTLSLGVAAWQNYGAQRHDQVSEDAQEEEEHKPEQTEDVIKRADNALYEAKQSGRNRVCNA